MYKELVIYLNVKYEKEVRFCTSVNVSKDTKGNDLGHHLPLFEYTNKRIISI